MLRQLPPPSHVDALRRPSPVHRLDCATAGLVLVARSHQAARDLSKSLREQLATKRYRAIVLGEMQAERGEVKLPLSGQESHSEWQLVRELSYTDGEELVVQLSLVDLWPKTGRWHQLRFWPWILPSTLTLTLFSILGDTWLQSDTP